MPVSPLLFGLLPALAPTALAAKAPLTTFSTAVPAENLDGTATLALVALPGHPGRVAVRAKLDDDTWLLAVDPTSDRIVVGDALCGALGGKKKDDRDFSPVDGGGLTLGALSFAGVDLACAGAAAVPAAPAAPVDGIDTAALAGFDGVLGLAALGALPWSLHQSAGQLIVGTASLPADGAALAVAPATEDVRLKTDAGEHWIDAPPLVLTATVAGTAAPVALVAAERQGRIDAAAVPPDALRRRVGDAEDALVTVVLGNVSQDLWLRVDTAPAVLAAYPDAPPLPTAVLGLDSLATLDLAWDPAARQLRLAPAPPAPKDGTAALVKRATAALEAAQQPPEGAPDPAAVAGAALTLGQLQLAAGDLAGALDTFAAATAARPESCDTWLALGQAQRIAAPTPAAAVTALDRALAAHESWWQWDTEVRARLSKLVDKAEKDETAYTFDAESFGFVAVRDVDRRDLRFGAPAPALPADGTVMQRQPASCHVARTERAALDLLAGDHAAVEAHYAALDLDPGLARIAGLSRLAQGDAAGAQAAARQAIAREHSGWDARSRALLGLAKHAQGSDGRAALDRAIALAPHDPGLYPLRLSLAPDAAARLTLAKALAEARPQSVAAAAAWAQEAARQGRPTADAVAHAQAAATARAAQGHPDHAARALVALAAGQLDEAARAAAAAVETAPLLARGPWALAQVRTAQGDETGAAQARAEAARRAPDHPAYALAAPKGS